MSAHESLVDVQGYYNRLSGALPSRMPPNLIQLALTGNFLSGPLPALPRNMKYLSAAQNGFSGPLPAGPGAAQLWFVSACCACVVGCRGWLRAGACLGCLATRWCAHTRMHALAHHPSSTQAAHALAPNKHTHARTYTHTHTRPTPG
jgi:hypothetical protein